MCEWFAAISGAWPCDLSRTLSILLKRRCKVWVASVGACTRIGWGPDQQGATFWHFGEEFTPNSLCSPRSVLPTRAYPPRFERQDSWGSRMRRFSSEPGALRGEQNATAGLSSDDDALNTTLQASSQPLSRPQESSKTKVPVLERAQQFLARHPLAPPGRASFAQDFTFEPSPPLWPREHDICLPTPGMYACEYACMCVCVCVCAYLSLFMSTRACPPKRW